MRTSEDIRLDPEVLHFRWDNLKPMSVNRAYSVGRKTMFKSKEYREYETAVNKRLEGHHMSEEMKTGKLGLKFKFRFQRSNSDIDNPVKPLQDVLQKHFGFDDKQVYRLEVEKYHYRGCQPFVEVEITQLPDDINAE